MQNLWMSAVAFPVLCVAMAVRGGVPRKNPGAPASGSMKYHKIEKRNVKVSLNADGSVSVSFTSVITATIWGSYGTWTLNGTMLLVKRNGKWIRTD